MNEETIINWENLTETEKNQFIELLEKAEEPKSKELMLLEKIAKDVSEIKIMLKPISDEFKAEIKRHPLRTNAPPPLNELQSNKPKTFWEMIGLM